MSFNTDISKIRAATETVMNPNADPDDRRDAAIALHRALSELVTLEDHNPTAEDLQDTLLPSGKAISPQDAARCTADPVRTGAFMAGVAAAIDAARQRFPDGPVRVLYAGCGPFGTLVLPLAHRWRARDVRFTFLDIHQRSLDAARQVASRLGVLDRMDAFVQTDAATYRARPDARPHVLITETMQRALEKEPQVTITTQLMPQMAEGAILVPERIELHLTLLDPATEFGQKPGTKSRLRQELGCVMSLDHAGYTCHDVTWPEAPTPGLQPFIRTHIRVFGDIEIGDNQSGLTIFAPLAPPAAPGQEVPFRPGQRLKFDYAFAPAPRLTFTV